MEKNTVLRKLGALIISVFGLCVGGSVSAAAAAETETFRCPVGNYITFGEDQLEMKVVRTQGLEWEVDSFGIDTPVLALGYAPIFRGAFLKPLTDQQSFSCLYNSNDVSLLIAIESDFKRCRPLSTNFVSTTAKDFSCKSDNPADCRVVCEKD